MSRPRATVPFVRQKVNLPATLVARFGEIHWDPVLRKPQYGAISHVLTTLLTDYVNRMEHGGQPLHVPTAEEPAESKLETL